MSIYSHPPALHLKLHLDPRQILLQRRQFLPQNRMTGLQRLAVVVPWLLDEQVVFEEFLRYGSGQETLVHVCGYLEELCLLAGHFGDCGQDLRRGQVLRRA